MRSFTQLNKDDFLVYLKTTKQFGTASSINMHWNEIQNRTTHSEQPQEHDEMGRKEIPHAPEFRTIVKISGFCT